MEDASCGSASLQVRDFIRHRLSDFPIIPASTVVDRLLKINPTPKGRISKVYNILISNSTPGFNHLRATWSDNLNIEIGLPHFIIILKHIYSSSVCAQHRIIQCKVVRRVHWSKSKLAQIFPDMDSSCVKCGLGPATLAHMFWTCPSLSQFWESSVMQTQIPAIQ